jgi:hypothetical protein
MTNKRFLFLATWIEGSDTARNIGAITGVSNQDDLLEEYEDGNAELLVIDIFAPNADVARAIGWHYAISDDGGGYTLEDTVSSVREIIKTEVLVGFEIPRFTVNDDGVVQDINHDG